VERKPGYRNVVALGVVSFFTDMSTEMILGVLPVFLVEELRATRATLGLIEGLAELSNYVFRLISGAISDKLGRRKPFVFLGYLFSSVAKPLFAFATTWIDALVVRVLDRVGKGVRTSPRDALISQSIRGEEAGRAFGIHRTLDQMGAIIGPLAAFTLIPIVGVRNVFIASFLPALAALLVLSLAVVEVRVPRREGGFMRGVRRVLRSRFIGLLLALSLFNLGSYNFSFVLVRAGEMGVAAFAIPLIYMLMNVAHAAVGVPAGLLADRIGREKALILGMLMFTLSSLMFLILSGSWVYSVLIALIFGLFQGVYDTTSRAVIPQYVSEELRGTAYGVYYLVVGLSFLLGISTVGYLWDTYGRSVAFTYTTLMSVVSAALLYAVQASVYKSRQ